MRLPVSSRNTSSSVVVRSVRSRTFTSQPLSATATGLITEAPSVAAMVSSSPCTSAELTPADRAHGRDGRIGRALDAGDDHVVADGALELVGRALGDELAVGEDADPVGQLVGLLEVLGGEEDRGAEVGVQPAHLLPHGGAAHRVEAGGRLVEEQDLRVVDQGGGEVEPALHAAGVGADRSVHRVADVDELDAPRARRVAISFRCQAVEPGLQPEQLEPVCFGSRAASCRATPMRRRTCSGWVATS